MTGLYQVVRNRAVLFSQPGGTAAWTFNGSATALYTIPSGTVSYTVNAASNLLVVGTNGASITGVSVNGTPMVAGPFLNLLPSNNDQTSWYLFSPPTGAVTIGFIGGSSAASDVGVSDYTATGYSYDTGATASNSATPTATSLTGTISPSINNALVVLFGAGYDGGSAPSAGSGLTIRSTDTVNGSALMGDSGSPVASGSYSMTWTYPSAPSNYMTSLLLSFVPGATVVADFGVGGEALAAQAADAGLPTEFLLSQQWAPLWFEWLTDSTWNGALPIEAQATSGGGVTANSGAPLEWLSGQRIDADLRGEFLSRLSRDMLEPIEALATTRADPSLKAESAATARRDATVPMESAGSISAVRDSFSPIEALGTQRSDARLSDETLISARADSGLRAESGATASANSPMPIEDTGTAAVSVAGDGALPIEALSLRRIDQPIVSEGLAGQKADAQAPLESSGAVLVSTNEFAPIETIAAMQGDAPLRAETMGSLRRDANHPAEGLAGIRTDVRENAELLAGVRRDAVMPAEWLGAAVIVANALAAIEALASARRETAMPAEYVSTTIAIVSDTSMALETMAGLAADANMPMEWRLFFRAAKLIYDQIATSGILNDTITD